MNVIPIGTKNLLPADLPAQLRALAERIERGEINSMVVAYSDDSYRFLWSSSLADSLILTALAHACAVDRVRA